MKTILYTTPSAEARGGGQISLLLMIEKLDRTKFSPLLVVPAEGEVARRARGLGCAVVAFEFPPLRSFWRIVPGILKFRTLLKERNVALVHAEQPRAVLYAAAARAGLRIPLVWHVRSMLSDLLDPLLERLADRLILVARGLEGRFSKIGRDKAVVVYNGVDLSRENSLNPDSLPPKASPVLLCPGRLEYDKGQQILIGAVGLLKAEFPSIALWLAGRDEEGFGKELRRRAEGLGSAIRFLGERDDLAALMRLADVVVLPSFHEAFPRAVIEAMAAGRPVVASSVGGVPEAVEDGKTGLLVAPGDAVGLSEALARLLRDKNLREGMGREASRRVEKFSAAAMAAAIEKLYAGQMGKPCSGA